MVSKWGYIRIKDRVAGRFQDVGMCLLNDKDGTILESIEQNHGDVHNKVLEMFRLWFRAKEHTWIQLIECLNVAQFQSLAEEIKSVFCGRKRVAVVHNEEKKVEPTTPDLDMAYPSEGIK